MGQEIAVRHSDWETLHLLIAEAGLPAGQMEILLSNHQHQGTKMFL